MYKEQENCLKEDLLKRREENEVFSPVRKKEQQLDYVLIPHKMVDFLFEESLNLNQKLKEIMKEDLLCNVYEEYLKKLYAWENFGFYYAVQIFKQSQSEEEYIKLAWDIYRFYLDEEALFKLGSTPENDIRMIHQNLDNPKKNMFDKLQCEAFIELANSTINEFVDDELLLEFKQYVDGVPSKQRSHTKYPNTRNPLYYEKLMEEVKTSPRHFLEEGTPVGFFSSFQIQP